MKKIMKKVLFIAVVALFGLGNVNAQEVKFGTKVGLNVSNFTGDTEGFDSKIGFNLGAYAEISLSDKLTFQPELLFSTQGASSEDSFENETFKLTIKANYLNIPLMMKYGLTDKFALEFGPQLGFLLSAKGKAEGTFDGQAISEEEDLKDFFKSIDFGLNFGASFDVAENIMIGARYNLGLSNIMDEEDSGDDKVQNAVFSLAVGYRF
jgi:opacity protein-like surface antigen|tara:strand:- start:36 stop:659 length:624 start_codon:yes stop_codon:yes gene_type:complete